MNRKVFLAYFFCVFLMFSGELLSQNHVTWDVNYDAPSQSVVVRGKIESSWHLYSPKTDPNLGPIPLSVTFSKVKGLKSKGDLEFLTDPIAHQDDNFGGMVYIWENSVEIKQRFKVKKSGALIVNINYMVCDETKCIPPIDVPITINIKKVP